MLNSCSVLKKQIIYLVTFIHPTVIRVYLKSRTKYYNNNRNFMYYTKEKVCGYII